MWVSRPEGLRDDWRKGRKGVVSLHGSEVGGATGQGSQALLVTEPLCKWIVVNLQFGELHKWRQGVEESKIV